MRKHSTFWKLVTSREKLRTLCIALAEVLNAIWKHIVLLKDLDKSRVQDILKYLVSLASNPCISTR